MSVWFKSEAWSEYGFLTPQSLSWLTSDICNAQSFQNRFCQFFGESTPIRPCKQQIQTWLIHTNRVSSFPFAYIQLGRFCKLRGYWTVSTLLPRGWFLRALANTERLLSRVYRTPSCRRLASVYRIRAGLASFVHRNEQQWQASCSSQ